MITIYTTSSCQSCRKAVKWLEQHKITFKEVNIFYSVLDSNELTKMLDMTEEGFDSIVSKRSTFWKNNKIKLGSLSFKEAQKLLIENPQIIRRPIIVDYSKKNIQIGYNKDRLDIFNYIKKNSHDHSGPQQNAAAGKDQIEMEKHMQAQKLEDQIECLDGCVEC